jgi:prefoldin alpha subunit
MEQEELMMELYKAQQQSKDLEEKMKMVEQQLTELQHFSFNLEELKNKKENEMLASLGKGVFIKTEIKDDKLFVDVGNGVFLRKTLDEANEVVADQIKKLSEMKLQLAEENESINVGVRKIVEDAEKTK